MLGHAAGLLCLAYAVNPAMVILYAVVHGFAWGLRGPLMQAIRADYFGRSAIGMILGLSFMIIVVGQVGGPMIAGILADLTGNYRAGFTILAASIVALRADNLKRRLAYSTVSQLSYVVLATSLLAPLSVAAAALHIATHAVGKITLFFAAGAIYTASHKSEVSQLDGIGRRMPWTMGAFSIGALSLIGIPPAAGFLSKWLMFQGAAIEGHWMVFAVLGLSTILNAAYFLPIVHAAFLREPRPGDPAHGEAPWTMVAAMSVTAAATLVLPFVASVPLGLARSVAGLSP